MYDKYTYTDHSMSNVLRETFDLHFQRDFILSKQCPMCEGYHGNNSECMRDD